ncbi:FUSC family protein [Sphingobacterium paludis]|uniref:Fusaric acid resistance family protein n=1 Tax=Sphingobacterium paludis TaxID=1476465 RepID=A0A4V3E2R0_9SPHI|nr:FUSC family protein [Sphingobacterium paludis]TDS17388.1 fusaric acid resistance family protein [Sphingobacterium paludis]
MIDRLFRRAISSPVLVYILRCLIGFSIGYVLYRNFAHFELFWSLLSIILVISPEETDSKRLSIERFKSNFVGSFVALLCIIINGNALYMIVIGIIITILVCRFFHIMNMARVAVVALLIIMIQPHQEELSYTPIFRFLSVAMGCLIGLTIVVSSAYVLRELRKKFGIFIDQ